VRRSFVIQIPLLLALAHSHRNCMGQLYWNRDEIDGSDMAVEVMNEPVRQQVCTSTHRLSTMVANRLHAAGLIRLPQRAQHLGAASLHGEFRTGRAQRLARGSSLRMRFVVSAHVTRTGAAVAQARLSLVCQLLLTLFCLLIFGDPTRNRKGWTGIMTIITVPLLLVSGHARSHVQSGPAGAQCSGAGSCTLST
jgi:hypothetical protein